MPSKWKCTCGHDDWPCHAALIANTPFRFLDLPGELRNEIYTQVFSSEVVAPTLGNSVFLSHEQFGQGSWIKPTRPPYNLFSVCRLIREEASSSYFAQISSFTLYRCKEETLPAFRDWSAAIGDRNALRIRKLVLIDELSSLTSRWGYECAQPKQTVNGASERKLTATFDLIRVPPLVTIRLARQATGHYTVTNGRVVSMGIAPVSGGRRRDFRGNYRTSALNSLKTAVDLKLQASFGTLHGGRYTGKDLAVIISIFTASVRECFAGGRRRYWLRKR
jgi:hypothetical protein